MTIEAVLHSLLVSDTNSLGMLDLALATIIPFLLAFPITWVYKRTQLNNSYSLQFVQSMFLFAVLTSVVTLIIGSNVARAFGLVGALSIIRFRNALKSPIDAVYIFWALAIGMACGTGYYLAAVVVVTMCVSFMLILHKTNYGEGHAVDSILRVGVAKINEANQVKQLEAILAKNTSRFRLLNVLFDSNSEKKTYVYMVRTQKRFSNEALQNAVDQVQGVQFMEHINNESPLFLAS